MKVLATSDGIKVVGANPDEIISVYSIDGACQQSIRAKSSIVEIPLNKSNIYVVKVGTKIVKLRL